MSFVPVAPIQILEAMKDEGLLGTDHLLLAHHVLEHPTRFYRLLQFLGQGTKHPNKVPRIIIDNSIVELGSACTAATMFKALEPVLRARETWIHPGVITVVLPDVMGDGAQTRSRVSAEGFSWRATLGPQVEYMMVLQGKDLNDFARSTELAKELLESDAINSVAIPRILVKTVGGRSVPIEYARTMLPGVAEGKVFMHMLGFSDTNIMDIILANKYGLSIDSAVPLRYAGTWCPSVIPAARDPEWFDKGSVNGYTFGNLNYARNILRG